jgi:hypothetical protein
VRAYRTVYNIDGIEVRIFPNGIHVDKIGTRIFRCERLQSRLGIDGINSESNIQINV